jgi:hypothetical protein
MMKFKVNVHRAAFMEGQSVGGYPPRGETLPQRIALTLGGDANQEQFCSR